MLIINSLLLSLACNELLFQLYILEANPLFQHLLHPVHLLLKHLLNVLISTVDSSHLPPVNLLHFILVLLIMLLLLILLASSAR
jgi:hypothetical protein